jgi:hypothetical protein
MLRDGLMVTDLFVIVVGKTERWSWKISSHIRADISCWRLAFETQNAYQCQQESHWAELDRHFRLFCSHIFFAPIMMDIHQILPPKIFPGITP